jgi:hypothetical protein
VACTSNAAHFLETIGKLKALAVDKTRTISEGRPRVSRVVSVDSNDKAEIGRIAAAFDRHSDHPLLRMLGLFDRPADEKALEALLKSPAIPGLTESLTDLYPTEWQTILSRLRRARLLAGEDPYYIILGIWIRILSFVNTLANSSAVNEARLGRNVIGGSFTIIKRLCPSCRIVSGRWSHSSQPSSVAAMPVCFERCCMKFTFRVFSGGMRTLWLTFLERRGQGSWGSPVETAVEEQSLTAEDQLFILMQVAKYLTNTRGLGAPEARICYERAEPLCHSLNQPRLLCLALRG